MGHHKYYRNVKVKYYKKKTYILIYISLLIQKIVIKKVNFRTFQPGHRVPRFNTVNWAICAPSACSANDVETALKHTLAKHTAETGLKITVKVEPEMCQMNRIEPLPTETLIVG